VGEPAKRRVRLVIALIAGAAVTIAAVRPIFAMFAAFATRVDYPFDLEWMEGGQLVAAERFLRGEPVYVSCANGFMPLPYPPLHFFVIALVGAVFGVDYTTGRVVSIAALVLCCALLAREVWKLAPGRIAREVMVVLAIGSIAAGYGVVDGWYDLIRVDMLFAVLVIAATAVAVSVPASDEDNGKTTRQAVAVGVLLTLAFFAKQTAAIYGPWLVVVLWRRQRRAAIVMVATGAICTGVTLGALQLATGGWYWTETITVMSGHVWFRALAVNATTHLALGMPYLVLLPPLWLVAWRKGWVRPRTAAWLGLLLFAVPQSIFASAKAAAYINNLMMAVVLTGPVTLMLVADVARGLRGSRLFDVGLGAGVLLCVCVTWPWPFRYTQYMPTAADRAAAQAINRMVAGLDGEVIMPEHPFVPIRNGKSIDQPHTQAYHDHGSLPVYKPLACAAQLQAEWALLGTQPTALMSGMLRRRFEPAGKVSASPAMRSGYRTRPRLLLRRRAVEQRTRQRVLFDFEEGRYDGWETSGNAFTAPLRTTRHVLGSGGDYFASSLHRRLRDHAKGSLTSPRFLIDRDVMVLLVGGGGSGARVMLMVAGRRVRMAVGRESNVMIPNVWDVSRWRGQWAQLHVVDQNSGAWGHIHLDDVQLFDRPPL
jgi:hypothetical protein